MKKTLIVIDMQNDFIDGALGTKEAQAIVPNVKTKIDNLHNKNLFKTQPIPSFVPMGVRNDEVV